MRLVYDEGDSSIMGRHTIERGCGLEHGVGSLLVKAASQRRDELCLPLVPCGQKRGGRSSAYESRMDEARDAFLWNVARPRKLTFSAKWPWPPRDNGPSRNRRRSSCPRYP